MSERVKFNEAEVMAAFTRGIEDMSKAVKPMLEAFRVGAQRLILSNVRAHKGADGEAMAALRYRLMLDAERTKARRYLQGQVIATRAEIRARGLNIPAN